MTNRMRYGACITYRPIAASLVRDEPDSRPVERLPVLDIATENNATARDRALASNCSYLGQQATASKPSSATSTAPASTAPARYGSSPAAGGPAVR